MAKMKRAMRDKWCAELRSGKYEQGVDALRDKSLDGEGYQYCCLGVLMEIAGFDLSTEQQPVSSLLPNHVARAVGLPTLRDPNDFYGRQSRSNLQVKLAKLNSANAFPTIAAWIEQNVPVED